MAKKRLSTDSIDFTTEDDSNSDFEGDWSFAAQEAFDDSDSVKKIAAHLLAQGLSVEKANELISRNRSISAEIAKNIQQQEEQND